MLLEIKELSVKVKSSGVKAVNGINLSVDEGEPLLILGQSGSGKTMICRALFGLTNRYNFDVSGQIFFEGKILCRRMQRNEENFTEVILHLSLKIQ